MWGQVLSSGTSARAVGCAIAYLAAGILGVAFTREAGAMAIFWPANALLLGLLLRMPPRDYPVIVATCTLASVVAASLGFSDSPLVGVTRAALNIFEVAAAII
jgi:integral membrane sensor domain MASE1